MMLNKKQFLAVAVIFLLSAQTAISQDPQVELKDLNIPNTPAFTLLDYSPTVIDRPGTAKAFAANVVSLLSESQTLPKNFAMEIAPYWLFKNKLTIYRYHGIDTVARKQNNPFANIRNASISFGSVYRDSSRTQPFSANYLAVGARVNLLKIIRKPTIEATIKAIEAIAQRQTELITPVSTACLMAHAPGSPEHQNCLKKGLEAAFENDTNGIVYQEERLQKILAIKPLFQADIAFAGSWAYKDNTFSDNHRHRMGIWTTMEWSIPFAKATDIDALIENRNYINVYGTLRYMMEDSTTDFKTFTEHKLLDIGGRFELEFDKLSVSVETIHRLNQTNDALNTSRNVGIIQYRVNDQLYISGTFGKNFGTVRNVIALFGLNWGFGKQALIAKK